MGCYRAAFSLQSWLKPGANAVLGLAEALFPVKALLPVKAALPDLPNKKHVFLQRPSGFWIFDLGEIPE